MERAMDLRPDMAASLGSLVKQEYQIPDSYYFGEVKRGLRNSDGTGVLIGVTKVGSVQGYLIEDGRRVPMPGRLYYRGIDLNEIVEAHRKSGTFGYEEVAYLLLMGHLPTKSELSYFNDIMCKARKLPEGFTEGMIMRHPSRDIMNDLARSVLLLYSYDENPDDTSADNLLTQSIKLIGSFPAIVANAYAVNRHYFDGESLHIHYPSAELSAAENFLRMIRPDASYTEEEAHLLDMMMMIHAEHGGGNNSTFTNRVVTSSGTDTYSAMAASLCSLKGPRHGGANVKVVHMFADIMTNVSDWTSDDAVAAYLTRILNKEAFDRSGLIYGIGHAIYTKSDPRALIFKEHVKKLAIEKGRTEEFELYERVERLAPELLYERNGRDKPICANVDFYSGFVYSMLNLPDELYTPIFAIARIAGWSAHRLEELVTNGKIIRPAYMGVQPDVEYVPLMFRKQV